MVSDRLSARVELTATFALVEGGAAAVTANDSPGTPVGTTARVTARRVARLHRDLTDRERSVLTTLARVKVATAPQLQRLHLHDVPSAARQCRRLLARLAEHRLVARLDRSALGVRGSAGWVYALDAAGQRLVQTDSRRYRRPYTPGPLFLRHQLAVTELAVRLVEAERRGEVEVMAFVTEPDCWRGFAEPGGSRLALKPDAFARLGLPGFEDSWFIEVDLGTEAPVTLARKFDAYRRYWLSNTEQQRHGVFPFVLWLVPNSRRYQQVVEVAAQQASDSWQLHRIALFEDAIAVLTGRPR